MQPRALSAALSFAAFTVVSAITATAAADEAPVRRSTPAPPVYAHPVRPEAPATRPLTGLLVAGPIVWGLAHTGMVVGTAFIADEASTVGLASIPLAGPWIILGGFDTDGYGPALIGNGVAQIGGFVMMVVGASVRVPVRDLAQSQDVMPEVEVGAGTTTLKWTF